MDDVTKRVFELAKGCIEELHKQKEYIALLESYIEDLENGVEVPSAEPVQLEQPLEMENTDDNMDNRRPSVMRNRKSEKRDQSTSGRECDTQHGIDNSDGGSGSTASPADHLDK